MTVRPDPVHEPAHDEEGDEYEQAAHDQRGDRADLMVDHLLQDRVDDERDHEGDDNLTRGTLEHRAATAQALDQCLDERRSSVLGVSNPPPHAEQDRDQRLQDEAELEVASEHAPTAEVARYRVEEARPSHRILRLPTIMGIRPGARSTAGE